MTLIERLDIATKLNPLSRAEMAGMFGSDTKARMEIQRLRREGHRICAVNNGKGYWTAKTPNEYSEFRKYYISYTLTTFKTLKAMDNHLEGQVEL